MAEKDFFTPHMPEVDLRPGIAGIFARARAAAAETHTGEDGVPHRQVILVTPGRLLIAKGCPAVENIPPKFLASLKKLVPSETGIQIAVIAYTYLDALKADLRRAVPFFDVLLGFAALGHTVCVFEGHSSALTAGCTDADLLLVDSAMLLFLDENDLEWRSGALAAMRGTAIKVVARQDA